MNTRSRADDAIPSFENYFGGQIKSRRACSTTFYIISIDYYLITPQPILVPASPVG